MILVFLKFSTKNTQMRHFSSKIPKRGIADSKLRHFCFSEKLCSLTNLRMLISDIRILFSNSSPKISKSSIFGPQLDILFFFRKILQIDKIEDAGFKYDNRFSKFLIQNYQNKAFLVKNTQIKHFWSQTQAFFVFRQNSAIRQIRGSSFQIRQQFFKILVPKYPFKELFIQNLGIFVFSQIFFQLNIIEVDDFKHDNISLKLLPKNTEVRHFQSQFQVFLLFCKISQLEKFERADFKDKNSLSQSIA